MPNQNLNPAQSDGDYVEVEVERINGNGFNGDNGGRDSRNPLNPLSGLPKAPVAGAWITLLIAWFFYAAQVPFTVLLAVPVNLAALALAVLCLARGRPGHCILIMILGTVGSLCTYLVSLLTFIGN